MLLFVCKSHVNPHRLDSFRSILGIGCQRPFDFPSPTVGRIALGVSRLFRISSSRKDSKLWCISRNVLCILNQSLLSINRKKRSKTTTLLSIRAALSCQSSLSAVSKVLSEGTPSKSESAAQMILHFVFGLGITSHTGHAHFDNVSECMLQSFHCCIMLHCNELHCLNDKQYMADFLCLQSWCRCS